MTREHDGRRARLAEWIADERPIDWDTVEDEDLGGLRIVEAVAAGFRRVASPAPREEPQFSWGPLRVFEEVGRGSFGDVYRAIDPRLDREVALKLRRVGATDDITAARSFLEEARRHARVRHPNVLTIHGADIHGGRVGLWTDFVRGTDLEARLETEGPLSVSEACRIGGALASALAAVHEAGLVHGDVKAANVLCDRDGRVLLSDFGAVSDLPRDGSASLRPLVGTPVAMPPEAFEGAPTSVAGDVYALGVLLFRLVTRTHPVAGRTVDEIRDRHRRGGPPSLRDRRPDVPAPFVRVVERAMAPDPRDRFEAMTEMAEALVGADRAPHNLPATATSFVGREAEIAHISDLVHRERVVTVTGTGGSGKSRLCLELARDALAGFGDGVFWIELSPLGPAGDVAGRVVEALDVGVEPGRDPLDALVAAVRGRRVLVILDNCEHVLDPVAVLVTRLLETCAGVNVLATSREPLRVPGEHVVGIDPLRVPEPDVTDTEALGANEAVRLFRDRARAVTPAFELRADTAPVVAAICRELDGIPLAIELAAAKLRLLTAHEVLDRLQDRFRLLVSRQRTGLPHHRTLVGLIEWSVEQLTDADRVLFENLSVFAGSFDLAAVEAIAAAAGDLPGPDDATAALEALVDKSLVERLPDGGSPASRYRMLETIRQFARRALSRSGREDVVAVRHRDHFIARIVSVAPDIRSPDPGPALELLDRDRENVDVVVDRCLARENEIATLMPVAALLILYWDRRNRFRRAREVSEALAARPDLRTETREWARTWTAVGNIFWNFHEFERARRHHRDALEVYRAIGEVRGEAIALSNLALVSMELGDSRSAIGYAEACIALARREGDVATVATGLLNRGAAAQRLRDRETARACYTEALALDMSELTGGHVVRSLLNLGLLAEMERRYDEARVHYERCLRVARENGALQAIAITLCRMSAPELYPEELDVAATRAEEALALARRAGDPQSRSYALEMLTRVHIVRGDRRAMLDAARAGLTFAMGDGRTSAGVQVRECGLALASLGDHEGATGFLAWSEKHRRRTRTELVPARAEVLSRARQRCRRALGDAAFGRVWAGSVGLTEDEILSAAMSRLRSHAHA